MAKEVEQTIMFNQPNCGLWIQKVGVVVLKLEIKVPCHRDALHIETLGAW
jgi:hypothetical protein